MNIVNVGYASTNYYAIDIKQGKLLVDCGWPGTLPQFIKVLQRKDMALDAIKYLLVTHFHPDHAGLVQELKNMGVQFILPECQASFDCAHSLTISKGSRFPMSRSNRRTIFF